MKSSATEQLPHRMITDLRTTLSASPLAQKAWSSVTPLAKNEWICWIQSAKHAETRARRIRIAIEQLTEGKRRPCCWPGCSHRTKNV